MIVSSVLSKIIAIVSKFRYKRKLLHCGKNVTIRKADISGPHNITIDDNVYIGSYGWLFAIPLTGSICSLRIKKGCSIGRFCHICATNSIVIDENVLIAERVYLTDNLHAYEDINIPIIKQPIIQKKEVVIGEGSWLGENVCIIGAKIGKHSVIGANSVVTHDIPDYCVAVGAPAKIIKRYNFEKKEWERV